MENSFLVKCVHVRVSLDHRYALDQYNAPERLSDSSIIDIKAAAASKYLNLDTTVYFLWSGYITSPICHIVVWVGQVESSWVETGLGRENLKELILGELVVSNLLYRIYIWTQLSRAQCSSILTITERSSKIYLQIPLIGWLRFILGVPSIHHIFTWNDTEI